MQRRFILWTMLHCLREQGELVGQHAVRFPVRTQRHAKVERARGLAVLYRRGERLLEIGEFPPEHRKLAARTAREIEEMRAMARAQVRCAGAEALGAEL